ncbi:MAG TPA: L28 family ribosomal protein [Patescibacteria group bacterium]|nr:L28 family ribosomal protein [Patescibacteria group bacterium]
MSRCCDICARGTTTSISRSHSNIKTKRKVFINLQTKKVKGGTIKACVRCLKQITK